MEHAGEPHRLAGLDAEGHDVLDLEVDRVADAHAVTQPVVVSSMRPLDAEHLADERSEPSHRTAELPAEDLGELVGLLVARPLVDEHPEPPVAVGHHLRRVDDDHGIEPADVGAVDLALADVEGERRAAEVVGRAMVEGQIARAHQLTRRLSA